MNCRYLQFSSGRLVESSAKVKVYCEKTVMHEPYEAFLNPNTMTLDDEKPVILVTMDMNKNFERIYYSSLTNVSDLI